MISLKRILVEDMGPYIYACDQSIEENLTLILLTKGTFTSASDAMNAVKEQEYTLERGFIDLRSIDSNDLPDILATDPNKPWSLTKLDK